MDKFTKDFVSRKSNKWLENFTDTLYIFDNEAEYKSNKAILEYNFNMAKAELLKRYKGVLLA